MLQMTMFMMDSTLYWLVHEPAVPLSVSASMHMEPPAVTCPAIVQEQPSGCQTLCLLADAVTGQIWCFVVKIAQFAHRGNPNLRNMQQTSLA